MDDLERFKGRFFSNKYAQPTEPMIIKREPGHIRMTDAGTDGTEPDLDDERYNYHVYIDCNRVIWTRVYSNGATHHELYCTGCETGMSPVWRNKFGNLKKLIVAKDEEFYFGKHKGKKFSQVPRDYLQWCATNMENTTGQKVKAYLDSLK